MAAFHVSLINLRISFSAKNAENVNYSKELESILIQSDEFAAAAVKHPELIRGAKVKWELFLSYGYLARYLDGLRIIIDRNCRQA
jgi:hypothetical protein